MAESGVQAGFFPFNGRVRRVAENSRPISGITSSSFSSSFDSRGWICILMNLFRLWLAICSPSLRPCAARRFWNCRATGTWWRAPSNPPCSSRPSPSAPSSPSTWTPTTPPSNLWRHNLPNTENWPKWESFDRLRACPTTLKNLSCGCPIWGTTFAPSSNSRRKKRHRPPAETSTWPTETRENSESLCSRQVLK